MFLHCRITLCSRSSCAVCASLYCREWLFESRFTFRQICIVADTCVSEVCCWYFLDELGPCFQFDLVFLSGIQTPNIPPLQHFDKLAHLTIYKGNVLNVKGLTIGVTSPVQHVLFLRTISLTSFEKAAAGLERRTLTKHRPSRIHSPNETLAPLAVYHILH